MFLQMLMKEAHLKKCLLVSLKTTLYEKKTFKLIWKKKKFFFRVPKPTLLFMEFLILQMKLGKYEFYRFTSDL
jgi:hypothetical protein